jgi:uncharacterized protein YjdB
MIRRLFLAFLVLGLVSLAGCGGTTDPPVATTITLSPTTLSFSSFGDTRQLAPTVLDHNGATISDPSVTWESSNSSVASVSSSGLVAAVDNGIAIITATSGSASGTASVEVGSIIGTWEFESVTGATASGLSSVTFTETTATLTFPDCIETATYTFVDGTLTVTVTAVDGPACDMIGLVVVFQATVTADTLTLVFDFFGPVTVVYKRVG